MSLANQGQSFPRISASAYGFVFNFHLRPSQHDFWTGDVHMGHFLWEGTVGWHKFPATATISIDDEHMTEALHLQNLFGALLIPKELLKGSKISILVQNRSLGTRKWNLGQIVLCGKVWD